MAGLWDSVPGSGGALDALEPLLSSVTGHSSTDEPDGSGGFWRTWTETLGGDKPLDLDLSTGAFSRGIGSGGGQDGVLELSGGLGIELGLHGTSSGSPELDGGVRLTLTIPSASLRLPFLRGAMLDGQGQLQADPAHPAVKFLLPTLKVRLQRPTGGSLTVDLVDPVTGTVDDDPLLNLVRMDPPYALVGPGNTVGFAFRAAVLDLSGTAGPTGVPAGAVTMPGEWQGLYLPEIRLFVAPNGLDGLAVSAGVKDLWIGFGRSAGVTGVFNAEIVNRGSAPSLRLRFQTGTGEWIGVPDTDPIGTVELPESVTLFADGGGGGVAPLSFSITVDGTVTSADRVAMTIPASGSVAVSVTANDAGSHTTTRTFTAARRAGAALTSGSAMPVTPVTAAGSGYLVLVENTSATTVTARLSPDPGGTVAWTWDGHTTPVTGPTAQITVPAGTPVAVTATITRASAQTTTIDAYFEFDHPTQQELDAGTATPWLLDPDHTTSAPWASKHDKGAAAPLLGTVGLARLAALPHSTVFTVEGWASAEYPADSTKRAYNQALSARRRDALKRILATNDSRYPQLGFPAPTVAAGSDHGQIPAESATDKTSPRWWRASATAHIDQTVTVTATLTRPVAPPPPQEVDVRPTPPPRPDCFHKIGVTVELVRSTFVRAEVYGEFDIQTAAEQQISASSPGSTVPARTNPDDGICQFMLRLRIAEDRSSWEVDAQFKAKEQDKDGLWQKISDGSDVGINILGALAVLSPLLAEVTPANPTAGELVPMALATGGVVALGAEGVIKTRKITLRGGQVVVTSGLVDPATGDGPRQTTVSILLDVETDFTFDVSPLLKVDPNKPLTARYKAVGLRSSWRSDPQPDGTVQYVPLPVFDPSQGYSLDIPNGSLIGPDALKDILRVLGGRISKDNPTYLEVEVGLGVDLGIVTVESARIRVRLDHPEVPQLTALGASVSIPDVLHGGGRVSIDQGGFSGSFDLTMDTLNLRVAAQLAVHSEGGVTGVLVGAEVQFPVAIPLGSSGLGILGFLGGVAVNYARDESPYSSEQVPALAWMKSQLSGSDGSIMKPAGWRFQAGAYAVAGGILLGTAEGGYIVHLKGMVLVEVPGPRLLFAMKADVISAPPALGDPNEEATFVAVLDINIGAGTITLGLVADYTVKSLLKVHVPVTAFFDTNHVEKWLVDLGTYDNPVTVSVLDVFTGTGYLMIHGDGSDVHIPTLPIVAGGLTIAVGFHMQVVLMGSKPLGLYLEVAAGFDALVSFSPPGIAGFIAVSGELRLWIIGISASASLTVVVGQMLDGAGKPLLDADGKPQDVTYVHGEVCGEVDFFFFSVKGCVSLTIGDPDVPAPVPPPLVKGVSLVSRSPALVVGSAVDRSVDGVIGTALADGTAGTPPSVPLDAIPVIGFETPPIVAAGDIVLGAVAGGSSGAPANPWVKHGDTWWRYRLTTVELQGPLQPPAGKTPATWWATASPDPSHGASLALLSWIPTATPRAVTLGQTLTTTVTETWGTVCTPVAEAAPVLWTFDDQGVGPSTTGWNLTGVAWPDADDTQRSVPADVRAHVSEPWRTGDSLADLLQGTSPAVVVGDAVRCIGKDTRRGARSSYMAAMAAPAAGPETSSGTLPLVGAGLQDVVDLVADGSSLDDLPVTWSMASTSGAAGGAGNCVGRILRSPAGDLPEPAPHGSDAQIEIVKRAWETADFTPADLGDAVVLHAEGGFASLDALLLVPRKALERGLVVHFRDADGRLLDEYHVTGADLMGGTHTVPTTWVDPAGPWLDPVMRAAQIGARVVGGQQSYAYALVSPKVPDGTVDVVIGWDRRLDLAGIPFWVVAFAATTASEVQRQDWDTTTVESHKSAVTNAVVQDPDDHALLVPGQPYTVHVEWEAQSVKQETQPAATVPDAYSAGDPQDFHFVADGQADAPARLDPWLLSTAPAVGEVGFLLDEPLQVALATQNVAALFDAYGLELRIVVRAASGRHPVPPGGGAAGSPVVVPLEIGGVLHAATDDLQVMTPWQQAVTGVLGDLPCTADNGSRTYHSVITLDYPLEPLTDYLMDVYAVPKGSPDSTTTNPAAYRVQFTTSRFSNVGDLAALVLAAPVRDSLVAVPSALAALGDRPTGDQLDAAFQAAGLPVPQVPRYPSITVLWSPDTIPQPVAVVVEGGETFWRSRPVPTFVTGLVVDDPTQGWWVAQDTDWLSLEVSATTPAAGDSPRAPVTRLVRAPGDTRAVVLLGPSARGTELVLDLVRADDPLSGTAGSTATTVRASLVRAPWEMED